MSDFNKNFSKQENLNRHNIFVSIVTTTSQVAENNWKKQLIEINDKKITECALFLTCIDYQGRKEVYKLIEESSIKYIPLIHLRDDFKEEEFDYFIKKFNTQVFNCHAWQIDDFIIKFPRHKHLIATENHYRNIIYNKVEPLDFGGLCIDLAHLYTAKVRKSQEYEYFTSRMTPNSVKVNHLNGFDTIKQRDTHLVKELSEFDFLKELPKKSIAQIICFELENSIEEQLQFKKHIEILLKNYLS